MKREQVYEKIAKLAGEHKITAEEVKRVHAKCYTQEGTEEGYAACMLDALPRRTAKEIKDDYEEDEE
ncbi:MAG: hypothetical protein ACTSRC_18715 [Candidatus Helarchaeota archaeon]